MFYFLQGDRRLDTQTQIAKSNMGPTWVLSASDGPHVGPMNIALWEMFGSARRDDQ